MTELVPVTIGCDGPGLDDLDSRSFFHFPARPDRVGTVTVHITRERLERWERAEDAWRTVQVEINSLLWATSTSRQATYQTAPPVCYVIGSGVAVHVKPGCRCSSRYRYRLLYGS